MFTIALIGPDGTGKSTIGRRLEVLLPLPTKYIYMGINIEESNIALPTTLIWYRIKRACGKEMDMGGPPDPKRIKPFPVNPVKRVLREMRSAFWTANLIADEWFRQFVAWFYQIRGYVVIFDRHFFFDYYKHHVVKSNKERTIGDWVHGIMLNYFYPKPDLVIFLDAPADVLFARKREGTLELLEQRRQEYLQVEEIIEYFVTVDTTQTINDVTSQIIHLVMDFYRMKEDSADMLYKSRVR